MGTFTDNLLKLTEFPFSYSFFGLLILISGGGGLFEDASEKLGPALILMGFFATTLSITDPIGHAQRTHLLGWWSFSPRPKLKLERWELDSPDIKSHIDCMKEFGNHRVKDQIQVWVLVCLLERFYFKQSDNERKKDVGEYQDIFDRICKKDKAKREKISEKGYAGDNKMSSVEVLGDEDLVPRSKKKNANLTEKDLKDDPIYKLYLKLVEMKYRTTTSPWMIREVDKITSLWYFVIVIFTFIVALVFLPSLDDRLIATFQGINQTRDNRSASVPDEGTDASKQAQEESLLGKMMQGETTIAATQNETRELTGKNLIHHMRAALAATKTNDRQTALVEINAALEELNQLEGESITNPVVRYIIIGLSVSALLFVLLMIRLRNVGLKSMAGVTFKFFTEQVAINKGKEYYDKEDLERYDKDLEDILQYLNEGNWDLAGMGVTRIMDDYNNFIKEGVKKGEICKKEQKDTGIF
jgi:hypothetical protein